MRPSSWECPDSWTQRVSVAEFVLSWFIRIFFNFSESFWLLLPSTDVDVQSPDEKSVITYVSTLYDAFPKVPEGAEGISPNVSNAFTHL